MRGEEDYVWHQGDTSLSENNTKWHLLDESEKQIMSGLSLYGINYHISAGQIRHHWQSGHYSSIYVKSWSYIGSPCISMHISIFKAHIKYCNGVFYTAYKNYPKDINRLWVTDYISPCNIAIWHT